MGNYAEGVFTYEDTFTAEEGLFIAAALTEYDDNTEVIEDKQFGELVIEHYGWGYEGALGTKSTSLKEHYCSDAELGLASQAETDSTGSSIYPIFESSKKEVQTWKKKFKCIPREDLIIWGDYNSAKAQQISVKFEMCDDTKERFKGVTCKEKEEIQKWLQRKFIILLYNQMRFDPKGFHEAAIISESRINYIPISSQVRQIIPFKVEQTNLSLQDYDIIQLDSWTETVNLDLFKLVE